MGYGKITKEEAERRAKLAEQGLKVCSHCKRELPFEQFTKEACTKDGYCAHCKDCSKKMRAERKDYLNEYRQQHRDQIRIRLHQYYLDHREQRKEYNNRNKDKFAIARKRNDHRVHNRYKLYQWNAKRREIEFKLTLEEFDSVTQMPCFYCGSLQDDGLGNTYTGLDRMDASRGYFADNVVPCCEWCNKMKLDYTPLEWIAHIKKIYEHLRIG